MAERITVLVDSEVADFYRSVSEKDRRKLDLLVNLRLREAAVDGKPLVEIMDEISDNAKRLGLTTEVLESILDE